MARLEEEVVTVRGELAQVAIPLALLTLDEYPGNDPNVTVLMSK